MRGTALYGGAYGDDLTVANFWDLNWHFIILSYDGKTAKLYADGKLMVSSTKNWNLTPNNCFIGKLVDNTCFWNGLIDDVRVYNTALAPDQIGVLSEGK